MYYQLLRDEARKDACMTCALCDRPAQHRLLVPPNVLSRRPQPEIAVPRERRGLCRECGRGRHALSVLTDEDIDRLRDGGHSETL